MILSMYADAEDLAKAWVLSSSVAAAVNNKVFLAMPKGSPLPCVTLSRVGGGIDSRSDVPVDSARISFNVWGSSRPQAKEISKKLVSEADSLALTGGFGSTELGGRLEVAEVLLWLWLPDSVSDQPRYIVDCRFTVTTL